MEYYYQLLGLSSTADLDQVKKAYRKLAKELHPDTNPNPQAVAQFQQIQQAYEYIVNAKNNPYSSSSWGGYPPYSGYQYPPQGYHNPYQAGQNTQTYDNDSAFKAYSWESWDDNTARAYEKSQTQRSYSAPFRKTKNEEQAPPPPPKYEVPMREDILKISYEEAIFDAKIRLKGDKLTELEQWEEDVETFLTNDRKYMPPPSLTASTKGTTTAIKKDSSLLGLLFQINTKGKKTS